MQKKNISNNKRRLAILISFILTAATIAVCAVFGIIGVPVQKTVQTASYNSRSEIQYKLSFADNPLYNETNLKLGEGYVTKYINSIVLTSSYNFDCKKASDINGNYSVTAVLEAIYNNVNLIWRKEYPFIPQKTFSSGQASDSFVLPLKEYVELVDSIEKDTGVTTSAKMTISFRVNASAKIDGTPVNDTSVSTLVFDLSKDVLVMGGEPKKEQNGNVSKTISKDLLPKKMVLYVTIPLVCLFVGAIIYLLVYTCGVHDDPVKLQLIKIYKKYNSRIVELYPGVNINKLDPVMVKSFQDLLLIADELKKPIFKNSASNYMEIRFYVLDEYKVYIFNTQLLKANLNSRTIADIGYAFAERI